MTLKEKLEQSTEFRFYKSNDVSKEPDMSGLKSPNPALTREAFIEIYNQTEKAFLRVVFQVMGNTMRMVINDIKNNNIVSVDNLTLSKSDLDDLREASKSNDNISMGFAIFPASSKDYTIYPMSEHEVILFIKSWELTEF